MLQFKVTLQNVQPWSHTSFFFSYLSTNADKTLDQISLDATESNPNAHGTDTESGFVYLFACDHTG